MDAQTKNEIVAEITATAANSFMTEVQRFQNLKIKEIKSGTKQITASWKKSTKQ